MGRKAKSAGKTKRHGNSHQAEPPFVRFSREYRRPYENFTGIAEATDTNNFTSRTLHEMVEINARQLAFWSIHSKPVEIDGPLRSDDDFMLRQMFIRSSRIRGLESIQQRWPDMINDILEYERLLIDTHEVGPDMMITRI